MAKSRNEIDKEIMYRKIMPTAARKNAVQEPADAAAQPAVSPGIQAGVPNAVSMAKAVRRPGVTIPFKEDQDMVLVNLMEDLVASRVDATLDRFNCCKCNKCKKDIVALALNRLKPRYVVMRENDGERRKAAEEQYGSEVTSALVQAILVVKKEPRH